MRQEEELLNVYYYKKMIIIILIEIFLVGGMICHHRHPFMHITLHVTYIKCHRLSI